MVRVSPEAKVKLLQRPAVSSVTTEPPVKIQSWVLEGGHPVDQLQLLQLPVPPPQVSVGKERHELHWPRTGTGTAQESTSIRSRVEPRNESDATIRPPHEAGGPLWLPASGSVYSQPLRKPMGGRSWVVDA